MRENVMSLELNAKETALILIDLQKGIVERQLAPYSGDDVVARSSKLAESLRSAGGSVVYVHVLVSEVLKLQSDASTQQQSNNPPKDEELVSEEDKKKQQDQASQLVDSAGRQDGDAVVTKRQWDAFYATELDQLLRRRDVKTVILGGIATNFGVESTARSAQSRGYNVVFAHDAMTSMNEELHKFAVEKVFPLIGRVRSSDEISGALGGTKTISPAAAAKKSSDDNAQSFDQQAAKEQAAQPPAKVDSPSEKKDDQKDPTPHVTKHEDPIAYN
jgi:nicotinamidase-related amidase